MPNGDSKNWDRVCASVDEFRSHYGRWPKRVRLMPICFVDLVSHVLTPLGFAIVSSVIELIPEDDAEMIADDETGAEFPPGDEDSFANHEVDVLTRDWFGYAIFRRGLES